MKAFHKVLKLLILVLIQINSAFSQRSEPDNWPGFRGVNCAGIAGKDQDPPVVFGNNDKMIWKLLLPEGHSSPCIWGDNIFLTGFNDVGKKLKMLCIDRKKGSITWEKELVVTDFEKVNRISNPATATPATDGERVYFYFSSYGLQCYDFSGEMKWELKIPVPKSVHGMGTSPVVYGDLVILNCLGHQNDPRILAINKLNGSIVWKYSMPPVPDYQGDSYTTPVIYKDQAIIYSSEDVSGYSLKTGGRIWTFPIGVQDAVGTPVLAGGILYITTHSTYSNPEMRAQMIPFSDLQEKYDGNHDRKLDKNEMKEYKFIVYPEKPDVSAPISFSSVLGFFDKSKDGMLDSTEWKQMNDLMESFVNKVGVRAIRLDDTGNIGMTNIVWGNKEMPPHIPSPLYCNSHIYTIRDGGYSCFNAADGRIFYRQKLSTPGSYFASPVAAGNRIYLASRSGVIFVIDAGEKLKILAKNDLKELITASPAIVDHKIYVRTDKALYAFGEK